MGSIAGSSDHQRSDPRGALHREVQSGEAAHGDADNVRRLDPESIEHGDGVIDRVLLRVRVGIGRRL